MADTIKIDLKYPIPGVDGQNINRIRMGRMKVKHLKVLPKDFADSDGKISPVEIIPFIAALTELPIESIEEMDIADLQVVSEKVSDFLSVTRQTGEK